MIGVFDSGVGGYTALSEIRRLSKSADVIYLSDSKNAPYGTKTEEELVTLVSRDIDTLCSAGAKKILIACCTASTVYPMLDEKRRNLSVPIILPAAKRAVQLTKNGRIGVIATERTVLSRAFSSALSEYEVFEAPAQRLVSLIESGERDGRISENTEQYLKSLLLPLWEKGIDTLILGCTHFPHLEKEINKILPEIQTVSPSREGAKQLLSVYKPGGKGKISYLWAD